MTSTFILVFYGINLFIFLLALLWILVPAFYGLPSKPTRLNRIRKALQLVDLKPSETLYDLGAGDGRVLFIAAREFGAKAIGIEVAPVQILLIWLRIVLSGLRNRIQIRLGNFYKTKLKDADVVFIYATSREVAKLAHHLEKQMKAGSRLVSISADFPEWEPTSFDDHNLIFAYEMPPKEGSLTTYILKNS
jgi:SAM-dependent methyltransferase